MDLEILEKIGLSKAEIKVYLALLELGSTQSGRIVKETGLRKSTVYETVGRLQEKGLVSYMIKDSKKYFEAAHPEKLLDFVQEKKRKLEESELKVAQLAHELKAGAGVLKPPAEAHVFFGIEGFKAMRRDILRNAKGEHLLLGYIAKEGDVMPGFFQDWEKQREKLKIKKRVLAQEAVRPIIEAQEKKGLFRKYLQTRYLPPEIKNAVIVNIYGDRVVDIVWKENQSICFMLINQELANSYRQYFEYLWKRSKP